MMYIISLSKHQIDVFLGNRKVQLPPRVGGPRLPFATIAVLPQPVPVLLVAIQ